jgi:hypothetical protein
MSPSTRRQRVSEFESITIRPADHPDLPELDRLADLDSTRLPDDEYLIAEVDGEARAAVGVRTGTLVATPFHATADLADLLRLRVERIRESGSPRASTRGPRRRLETALRVNSWRRALGSSASTT